MDLLQKLKEISATSNFIESKNYYYQYHKCINNTEQKIMLDFTLSTDLSDNIIRFGICNNCNKCFYHKDFVSKGF